MDIVKDDCGVCGFLDAVRKKKIPALQSACGAAELCFQEFDIMKAVAGVKTLDDVSLLIDKLMVYVGMSKKRIESEGVS